MSRRHRLVANLPLIVYTGFLAFVVWQGDASFATSVVRRFAEQLEHAGASPILMDGGRVELVLNAAMFAPLALLAALLFPKHPWANWVVYGFVISVTVELVQAFWLPQRSAQYVDVVANTGGALAGALLSLLVAEAHKIRPTSTNSKR